MKLVNSSPTCPKEELSTVVITLPVACPRDTPPPLLIGRLLFRVKATGASAAMSSSDELDIEWMSSGDRSDLTLQMIDNELVPTLTYDGYQDDVKELETTFFKLLVRDKTFQGPAKAEDARGRPDAPAASSVGSAERCRQLPWLGRRLQ